MHRHERRVARQLHDLLSTAVFALQPAKPGNHRSQQLHHNGCADVRHNAQGKDGAIFERAAAEQIKERRKTASSLAGRGAEPFLQDGLIDSGSSDRRAQAHNHNHGQRKQDTPA